MKMTADESRIALLLDELYDERLTPEEACRDHPELLDEVRKQWQRMSALQAKLEARFPSPGTLAEEGSATQRPVPNLPQIPGYDVQCVLGHGGMGVVYKARHVKLDRTVAIKMLLTGMHAGPQELARFLAEAKAVASLRYPNIVQVYDVGDLKGRPYFTMEFLEGGNLAQKLAGQPQPARKASEITVALAEAMQIAHRNGIIHRDLKPANILLTAEGTPKIADFGLARRFDSDEHLTVTGARIGTLSYMAPEQALGKPGLLGPAVDIYSLGAVLYELLTGRPPFRAETPQETERQLLTEEPVPPRRLNSAVPRDLETICLKCVHRNPTRRYESAETLASDLHRFLRGEPITARPASFGERSGRWLRCHPTLTAALSIGLLTILAALGLASWLVAEHQANRQAIEIDLQEAAKLQRMSNWAEARIALERARARPGAPDVKHLLERVDRDQQVAARLDKIRADRAVDQGWVISYARSVADYESIFRDAGLGDRDNDPALVASRIKRTNIQDVLVAALEDWASITDDHARLNWLLQIARQAAPDPTGWRRRALTLDVWTKPADLAKLISSVPVTENSVPLLLALGERYFSQGGDPVDLYIRCQRVRPNDFWTNWLLGQALSARSNPGESLRYYQSAVAIRPDSDIAYNSLGLALSDLQRLDEAIDALQAAVMLNPKASTSVMNLSMLLSVRGRHAEAIPALQTAIVNSPRDARLYGCLGCCLNAVGERDEAWKNLKKCVAMEPLFFAAWTDLRSQLLRQGLSEQVRTLWRTALAAKPDQHAAWDGYAELSLFLGKEDEYRWARRELLNRFNGADDPHVAERTGRACLLLPGTDDELRQAAALIGKALDADRSKLQPWVPPFFGFAEALSAYRQGRFKESAAILKGDASRVLGPAPGLVLAMDQYQLGEKDLAQETLDNAIKAFDWQQANANSREPWMYQILRREAEALIK
jgi:serine/threonine-protein kinase